LKVAKCTLANAELLPFGFRWIFAGFHITSSPRLTYSKISQISVQISLQIDPAASPWMRTERDHSLIYKLSKILYSILMYFAAATS
jgi:hypothetical protein